jgi:hypothetical protein
MNWTVKFLAIASLAAAGCGTVPEVYHPRTVGPVTDSQNCDGIVVKLAAHNNVIPLGRPAAFSVTVRNTSDRAIWLPKKPQQGFFWTYPNGRHDCYMIEREAARFFRKAECLLLQPGEELILPGLVETSYFNRPGITEFLAEIDVARNTNPELQPFWSGRVLSNGYGLQLIPFRNVAGI